MQLELRFSSLHVGKRRRPERVRSLPSEAVEFLYQVLDPESRKNPFRNSETPWRVYVCFLLMLHLGLRRGELLASPLDAIKTGFDRSLKKNRFWMTVCYNGYEVDNRYSTPGIKNEPSIRQIPVSSTIALAVQEYTDNYRGPADHSFLINSQLGKPLSTEGITKIFQKISSSLPASVRKALHDQTGKDSLSAHDLRHTCAVVRLNQLLSEGDSMDNALQKIRSYFGWSRKSRTPLRYARAVFEQGLAAVWSDRFDDRVEFLRSLPGRIK